MWKSAAQSWTAAVLVIVASPIDVRAPNLADAPGTISSTAGQRRRVGRGWPHDHRTTSTLEVFDRSRDERRLDLLIRTPRPSNMTTGTSTPGFEVTTTHEEQLRPSPT